MCDQSSSATNGPKSELSRTDSSHVTMPASIAQLETIKREVESRQEILGKSWHDLHEIMSKYHATLVLKHEQFEASVDAGDRGYLVKLELSLEKANEENHRLERTVSDLQASLLAKENEIVHLRQENNKLRKETKTKDNLIEKLQNQMAREAMDYSNEINALKELLEGDGGLNCGAMVPTPPTSTTNIITSGNSRKRAKFETGNVTRSQTSMKSDAAPSSCLLQSGGAQAQYASLHPAIGNDAHLQTFSMATMPHLTLATTSTDAMHVDSSQDESTINPDESAEGDYAPFTELLEQKLDDPDTDMLTHNAMQSQQDLEGLVSLVRTKKQKWPSTTPSSSLVVPPLSFGSPRVCKFCGRMFGAKYDLDRHERIHSGERPFLCGQCGKRFARKDHLRLHLTRVHGDANAIAVQDNDLELSGTDCMEREQLIKLESSSDP